MWAQQLSHVTVCRIRLDIPAVPRRVIRLYVFTCVACVSPFLHSSAQQAAAPALGGAAEEISRASQDVARALACATGT